MYTKDIYQPFAHVRADRLAFGVVVHHRDDTFEQVELFSMTEDNNELFARAMRFEGVELCDSDVDSVLYNQFASSILTISKCSRDIKLFSSNLYFEVADYEDCDSMHMVLTNGELERRAYIGGDAVHTEYARPMRSLLTVAFTENEYVYTVLDHYLSDFLNEADLEIKEYITRWNRDRMRTSLFVA